MSNQTKKEYLNQIRNRYSQSTKEEKKKILDEFCEVCGYNRKYAIRLLNKPPSEHTPSNRNKCGRKKVYNTSGLISFLKTLWVSTNLICSKRLKSVIPIWLDWYEGKLSNKEKQLLLKISPSTIDRLLHKHRHRYGKRGLCTTKPGSLLRQLIPIKTEQWDETRPGFIEADTVAHCGTSVAGDYVFTLNVVDIATGWTLQRAVWGKGEHGVFKALREIELEFPFNILGFDCDNGNELLNWRLLKYFKNRQTPVKFTRSRAYHKNDNAHIEEKNWTVVRQYFGYQRIDKFEIVEMMNELYRNYLNLLLNFFIPSVKLIAKQRVGSKIIKLYDKPKTPLQRLMESNCISDDVKIKLHRKSKLINPFKLQKLVSKKINRLLNLASK